MAKKKTSAAQTAKTKTKPNKGSSKWNYRTTTHKRLFSVYTSMIHRCFAPHNRCYHNYGGRGISVCTEWSRSWDSFARWAIEIAGYEPGLCIDRINNDDDYCPQNCRWTTTQKNCGNTRRSHFVSHNGMRMILADWARYYGISPQAMQYHVKRGSWPRVA